MAPANFDVSERPDVVRDRRDQQADEEERHEEADLGQQYAAMRPVGNLLVDDVANLGEMQDEKNRRHDGQDEGEEDDCSGHVHVEPLSGIVAGLAEESQVF